MTGNNYILDFDLEQFRDVADIVKTMKRISVSGVQEKFPAIVENGKVRLARIDDDDFALSEGLSPNIETSEVMDKTGHPCRLDFFRFGKLIGIAEPRLNGLLDRYTQLPAEVETMISNSYLDEKTKRSYLRIVKERISRFVRVAED